MNKRIGLYELNPSYLLSILTLIIASTAAIKSFYIGHFAIPPSIQRIVWTGCFLTAGLALLTLFSVKWARRLFLILAAAFVFPELYFWKVLYTVGWIPKEYLFLSNLQLILVALFVVLLFSPSVRSRFYSTSSSDIHRSVWMLLLCLSFLTSFLAYSLLGELMATRGSIAAMEDPTSHYVK